MSFELSIIVPAYNERENIVPLFESLVDTLRTIRWELIVVDDDSPDGTNEVIRDLATKDERIRCIHRLDRRGLSSACIEGILSTASPLVCVMDADMQHDESLIPRMYSKIKSEDLDIVIGSRYVAEGSTGELHSWRKKLSQFATKLSLFCLQLNITDPMSGFFMVRRTFFEKVMYRISGRGFKILLDLIISSKEPVKVAELPYVMRSRKRGESKLDFVVAWDFLIMLISKLIGEYLPYRFISFITVGFSGLFVHMFSLWLFHDMSDMNFTLSQSIATFIAMTSNYVLNNIFTYHDLKKSGSLFWRGLLSFYLVCMLGAILNVALATELYQRELTWFIAGIFGALAGAVWNFSISNMFVWRKQLRT
ncbi:MAG: glycosyltransferase family 2 protein [Gammaproteobacteria bacterium]|nr:glycosyltransferase family 2 protein [Gammaproteobacteria bacterium]